MEVSKIMSDSSISAHAKEHATFLVRDQMCFPLIYGHGESTENIWKFNKDLSECNIAERQNIIQSNQFKIENLNGVMKVYKSYS